MNNYKIFLASSSKLAEDRLKLEQFLGRRNNSWVKKGAYLELIIWEDFLDAMSQTRLQEEYNKAVKTCDIFIMLYHTKVGIFTEEEFEVAFKSFKQNNTPLIYTCFKTTPTDRKIPTEDKKSLKSFQDKLRKLKHYQTEYKNTEDLLLKFGIQLDKLVDLNFIAFSKQTDNSSTDGQINPPLKDPIPSKTKKSEILNLIPRDIDAALDLLDEIFKDNNGTYNDLAKEYVNRPNNFSLASFRSRLKRFVKIKL